MATCNANTLLQTAATNGYFGLDDRSLKIAALQLLCSAISISTGTGSPEGVQSASVGSMYNQIDAGIYNRTWIKQTGTGNTGWV